MISIKRAYDKPNKSDGRRVLVDRLWPRGVSKQELKIDDWYKTIAPSTELRKWFAHDPSRWEEFKKRYRTELQDHVAILKELKKLKDTSPALTLVYAAKDQEHNNAVVLKEVLEELP